MYCVIAQHGLQQRTSCKKLQDTFSWPPIIIMYLCIRIIMCSVIWLGAHKFHNVQQKMVLRATDFFSSHMYRIWHETTLYVHMQPTLYLSCISVLTFWSGFTGQGIQIIAHDHAPHLEYKYHALSIRLLKVFWWSSIFTKLYSEARQLLCLSACSSSGC